MEAFLEKGIILKAVDRAGKIVGSVRGELSDGTLYVRKLMVHPDCRRQGLALRLLTEIEQKYPWQRCELFTSALSHGNLSLYNQAGYRQLRTGRLAPDQDFIFLEKKRLWK